MTASPQGFHAVQKMGSVRPGQTLPQAGSGYEFHPGAHRIQGSAGHVPQLTQRPGPDHRIDNADHRNRFRLTKNASYKGDSKPGHRARSRGGITTKIMALADALGNLTYFRLLPGQAHDLRGTAALIDGLTCGQFLADRAFDANWLREALADAGIEPVSLPSPTAASRWSSTAIRTSGGT